MEVNFTLKKLSLNSSQLQDSRITMAIDELLPLQFFQNPQKTLFGFGFSLSSVLALIDFMVQFIVLNYITPYYWRDQPQQCLNKVCIADQFYRVSLLFTTATKPPVGFEPGTFAS